VIRVLFCKNKKYLILQQMLLGYAKDSKKSPYQINDKDFTLEAGGSQALKAAAKVYF
jgi:hypothetical protein